MIRQTNSLRVRTKSAILGVSGRGNSLLQRVVYLEQKLLNWAFRSCLCENELSGMPKNLT